METIILLSVRNIVGLICQSLLIAVTYNDIYACDSGTDTPPSFHPLLKPSKAFS